WQEGESWVVGYQGTVSRLRDGKGIRFLAHLIRHPGADFLPGDLAVAAGAALQVAEAPATDQTRVNLTKTIKATIEKIATANPPLGSHLRGAVRTGKVFRYAAGPGFCAPADPMTVSRCFGPP
ncbi:MAG: hypothetical protein ACREQ9_09365, partial [Candidatus Binatia bacterium]